MNSNNYLKNIILIIGKITCGKSTTENYLKKYSNFEILNCDFIINEIYKQDSHITKILNRFLDISENTTALIDKKVISEIIFTSSLKKAWTETILHKLVYFKINQWISLKSQKIKVIFIPLIPRIDLIKKAKYIVFIHSTKENRYSRYIKKPNSSPKIWNMINNVQPIDEDYLAISDITINNNNHLRDFYKQLNDLIKFIQNN